MFTLRVTVPRITRTHLSQFEMLVPDVFIVSTVPVIETGEQALRAATIVAEKKLTRYEYISDREHKVTETATGWDFEFVCFGD